MSGVSLTLPYAKHCLHWGRRNCGWISQVVHCVPPYWRLRLFSFARIADARPNTGQVRLDGERRRLLAHRLKYHSWNEMGLEIPGLPGSAILTAQIARDMGISRKTLYLAITPMLPCLNAACNSHATTPIQPALPIFTPPQRGKNSQSATYSSYGGRHRFSTRFAAKGSDQGFRWIVLTYRLRSVRLQS
jgi:hypothetical protein